ncbi:hypothetical protein QR685DRAFT_609291 [Neurospora intermedia]|uniref:Uncharacterized protein n=1 Tax=Neurospora intermedia TaxID=5142 RepID=A0ABR3D0S9_NEUIN
MIAEPEDLVERPREGEEQRARNPCSSKTGERDVRFKEIYPELGLVNAIDAEKGTPNTVLYCNETFPKNAPGDYKNFRERIQSTHELVSPAYLTRFAANPKQELSVRHLTPRRKNSIITKVLNKGTNATRTRRVQAS